MNCVFADAWFFLAALNRAVEGIIEALTGDRHFEQAGFKALLK